MPQSILVVDPDHEMAPRVAAALADAGHDVAAADSLGAAQAQLRAGGVDLVMLELDLPDADGLLSLPRLRRAPVDNLGILVCTWRTATVDKVLALRLGADDVVGKPIWVDELEARVEALLRRRGRSKLPEQPSPERAVGDLVLSEPHRRVTLAGTPLRLTPIEYRIVRYLAFRPNEIVDRVELARAIWGTEEGQAIGNDRWHVLNIHLHRIRQKWQMAEGARARLLSVRSPAHGLKLWEGDPCAC